MSNYPLSADEFKILQERVRGYKQDIDLSTFIRETNGAYYKDENKSTRTNHILRKDYPNSDHAEEIISCWKRKSDNGPGHYMYANKLDSSDSGSIVEWVKSRNYTQSIIDVDKVISSYLNQPQLVKDKVAKADKITAAPDTGRNVKVAQYFNLSPLNQRDYLHKRGIEDRVLDSKEFSGRVFNEIVNTKGGSTFTNTAFPIFSKTGDVIGIERKNYGYHDPERSFSRSAAGSEKEAGLWNSKHSPGTTVDKLFLCEAAIDCLSHHQLKHNGTDKVVYMASNGPWTTTQIDIVQSFINSEKPAKIILGHDNDPQGYKYNIHMAGQICRPTDYIEKSGDKPVAGSGIITEDTAVKVACTNAGRYLVKLNFDISYNNPEEGTKILEGLKQKFKELGVNEEGFQKFDAKVTKQGPNNAEMDVFFPNSTFELGQARDLVIGVRKMENYIVIEKPRDKDWNLDLKDSIEKSQNLYKGNDKGDKDSILSTGDIIPKSMVKSFQSELKKEDFDQELGR
ncbi:toprim domain-containing protein [Flavobacterium sp. UBA6046]|uniref:toprim domain-containing protein n=1 Tax=Flavobacterium sp. UBA6046 TaxID=1946552 RepID=UPI0025B9450A|nr:toprim domain-containing protein [Flavobacterium sp. UBA6046]